MSTRTVPGSRTARPQAALATPTALLGAHLDADGVCRFCVWAPAAARMQLRIHGEPARMIDMQRDEHGYHTVALPDVAAGTRYTCVFPGGAELPDPASRSQPDGVHGPSAVVPSEFDWQTRDWPAPNLRDLVLYELHVGTFTGEGTFDAAIARLDDLRALGITAIELMPIVQFPGGRNWGYDGVYPFAAQSTYGGPLGLKRLVDAAHARGLAVVLDVVCNHLGPEGNYLSAFGPYFTSTYHTPWGAAVNYDEADSDHVRRYFIESALQWTDEFRIDALRVDAIHAIHDRSALPFLRELAATVRERARMRGRTVLVIAESDLGDPRVVRPARLGGLGMDAQWLDDFHHALRTVLTGELAGYYVDFGRLEQLAFAFEQGFVYTGQYSRFRRRRHGAPGGDIQPRQFVVYAQNHDQIGNRMLGDRLATAVSADRLRLAAATVLLSSSTPLLFMGEEYGERRPFPYFVSHGEASLIAAVRSGRLEEFASFAWQGEAPDPQAEATFASARLDWSAREEAPHRVLLELHRELLRLRREVPSIRSPETIDAQVLDVTGQPAAPDATTGVLRVHRRAGAHASLLLLNFAPAAARLALPRDQAWQLVLDTADPRWGGPGNAATSGSGWMQLAPHSALLLVQADPHA